MTKTDGQGFKPFAPVEERIENRVVFKVGGVGGKNCVYVSVPCPEVLSGSEKLPVCARP